MFSGVTGIVTKPIEGAKKDGAAGFFKGIGKGLIGVVARPVSGVIDLASSTFEGIQKYASHKLQLTINWIVLYKSIHQFIILSNQTAFSVG